MKNSIVVKSVLCGIFQGLVFGLLWEFDFSIYTKDMSAELRLIICVLSAIFSSSLYCFFIFKENRAVKFFLCSIISFLTAVLVNIAALALPFRLLPLRETTDGDGLFLLVFIIPTFILTLIISKIIALAVTLVRIANKLKV